MSKTLNFCLLLICQFDAFPCSQLLANFNEQLCPCRHVGNDLRFNRPSQCSFLFMNCIAFSLELCDSMEENVLRSPNFFLERIDDDRRLIDLACLTIWSHLACLRVCMNVRSHRLKNSRIQSSRGRGIGG